MEVRDLVKHFPIRQGLLQRQVGAVHAVDGVSFDVLRGETLGLVGESGCGKSTTARLMLRLMEPTSGSIRFEGEEIAGLKGAPLKALRREMQMIFQDPYSSLNPRKTVGTIISEPFVIHGLEKGEGERKRAVQELMDRVGLNPEHYNRYPHEFSGGQRQRIGVARALALQAEGDRGRRAGVRARRVDPGADPQPAARAAARAGDHADLHRPRPLGRAPHVRPHRGHVPGQDRRAGHQRPALPPPADALHGRADVGRAGADPRLAAAKKRQVLAGDVPSPTNPPPACRFHTRCWKAQEICRKEDPPLEAKDGGNLAACHFPLTDAEVLERVPTARTA